MEEVDISYFSPPILFFYSINYPEEYKAKKKERKSLPLNLVEMLNLIIA
jgi:hypothetical protein